MWSHSFVALFFETCIFVFGVALTAFAINAVRTSASARSSPIVTIVLFVVAFVGVSVSAFAAWLLGA